MAVQYDSKNNSWSTWIDKLKQDIPEASKEAEEFFGKMDKIGATITSDTLKPMLESTNGAFEDYIKNNKLADESLISFLKDTEYSEKTLANYQTYLKNSANSMTLFQRAGKAAGSALKSLGATLGSMAAAWAIGEAISLAITGIDSFINKSKIASDAAQKVKEEANDTLSEDIKTSDSLDDLISKYKELRESSDYDKTKRKDILDIQGQITDLVGQQASGLDLVNGKLDKQLGKLKTVNKEQKKKTIKDASNAYYASKDSSNKLVGDKEVGGIFGIGVAKGYDVVIDTNNKNAEALMALRGTDYNDLFYENREVGKIAVKAKGKTAKEKEKYLQGILDILIQKGLTNNDLFTGTSSSIEKYSDAKDDDYKSAKKYIDVKLDNETTASSDIKSIDDFKKKREKIIKNLEGDNTIADAIKNGDFSKEQIEQSVDSWMSTCEGFSDWYDKWENNFTKDSDEFDKAWSGLKKTEQNKFIKLVNNGKLTAETFNEIGNSAKTLKETGLSVDELCDKIRSMVGLEQKLSNLSSSMKKVGTAYKDYKKNGYVSSSSLNSMPDSFKNLDGYSNFSKIAGNKKSSKKEIQNAFNEIVTEYVSASNMLDDVTQKNKNKVITALRDAGIVNAEKVVNSFLNGTDKQFSQLESKFNKMSKSELQNFVKTLNSKGKVSSEFYKKIGISNANMINGLGDQYKTDFANWVELCEKKRDAYKKLKKAVGGKNTKEAKKNAIKLMSKDESKVTSEDMGAYEAMTKDGLQVVTTKKGKKKVVTKYDKKQKKLADKLKLNIADVKFDMDYSPTSLSGSKSNKDKSKSTQIIDWIERKLDRLNTKLDLVKAKYDNLPYSKKNSASLLNEENKNLEEQIKLLKQVQSVNDKSYSKYMSKANSVTYKSGKKKVKLSSSLKKKIQNGQIKGSYKKLVATYGEPKATAIQSYQDYYDKAQNAKKNSQDAKKSINDAKVEEFTNKQNYYDTLISKNQAEQALAKGKNKNISVDNEIANTKKSYEQQIEIAKLQSDTNKQKQLEFERDKAILSLERQKVENIKTYYDNQVGILDNNEKDIQNQIDLIETRGDIVNKNMYSSMSGIERQKITEYKNELADLQKKQGTFAKGSDEWYELQNDIQSVEDSINSSEKAIIDNTKSIGELNDKMYDAIMSLSDNINSELDTISGLKRGETTDSDTGTFTDTGLLQLYAAGLSYSATKGTSSEANKRLSEIIKANKEGKLLEGYTSLQAQKDAEATIAKTAQEQANSVKSYGDKIIELVKDAISSMTDHLQEIIDARKDALNEEKELRDYERSILEKTKSVTSLQKQYMAVSGDTSEEGRLKTAQLRKSLDEAQQDLQDAEYDKYISDQENMLDNLMNQFKDLMEKLQKDEETLLKEGITEINNSKGVMEQIYRKTAEEYGYPTSTNLEELKTALSSGQVTAEIINSEKQDSVTSVIKAKCDEIITAYNNSSNGNGNGGTSGDDKSKTDQGNNGNESKDDVKTISGSQSQLSSSTKNVKETDSGLNKEYYGNTKNESATKTIVRNAIKNMTGMGSSAYWTKSKTTPKSYTNKVIKKQQWGGKNNILTEKGMNALYNDLRARGILLENTKDVSKRWSNLNKFFKDIGFKTGGIAKLVKQSGEDGVALVRNGEGFVMPENVKDIRDLMAVTPDLTKLVTNLTNVPNVKPLDRNVTKNVSIDNITFDLPNVKNVTDFTDTIKKPEQQKAFAVAIGDAINGKKLNINRY